MVNHLAKNVELWYNHNRTKGGDSMIFDISDVAFRNVLKDQTFFLPIRWTGSDFSKTLDNIFNYYIKQLEKSNNTPQPNYNSIQVDLKETKRLCKLLKKAVDHYLNGFPAKAYTSFEKAMELLMKNPLKIYQKSAIE